MTEGNKSEVTIQTRPNGPLVVKGSVQLVNAEGKPIQAPQGSAIALCRCGHSANKPFCDGSHQKVGFQG